MSSHRMKRLPALVRRAVALLRCPLGLVLLVVAAELASTTGCRVLLTGRAAQLGQSGYRVLVIDGIGLIGSKS